jgi:MraZ protein
VEVETPPAPPTKPDAAPTPPPADRAAGWNDPRSPIATIPAAPLLYKVGSGKGESLRDIARRTLGSEDRWAEIDQLNPELRSQLIVPSGKVVKLPPGAKVDLPGGGQSESEFTPKGDLRPVPHLRPKTDAKGKKKSQPMTGSYTGKLDDQRAVAVPGDVWEQLGKHEAVLLTPGPDGCLWLATHSSAARLVERMEKSHHADRDVQAFKRIYYAQSVKAKVVDDGKVIVPDKLAEYAGLGKDVVLIGIDDHFELWDAARWQRYSRAQEPVWRTGGERD